MSGLVIPVDGHETLKKALRNYLKITLKEALSAAKTPESGRAQDVNRAVAALRTDFQTDPDAVLERLRAPGLGAIVHAFRAIESWPDHAPTIRRRMKEFFPRLAGELGQESPGNQRRALRPGLWLSTEDLNPLALEEAHPEKKGNAPDLGGRSLNEWAFSLDECLKTIEDIWPELHEEVRLLLTQIVPVGYDPERHLSASYREAIGTVYLSLHPDPLTMTTALIHEFQHNKLNLVSYSDPILKNAFHPLYPSPVRPDPRPLWGVLLAAHAFLPVAVFYRRLKQLNHPLSRQDHFETTLRETDLKNNEGIQLLAAHGDWTELGRAVMAELQEFNNRHMADRAPSSPVTGMSAQRPAGSDAPEHLRVPYARLFADLKAMKDDIASMSKEVRSLFNPNEIHNTILQVAHALQMAAQSPSSDAPPKATSSLEMPSGCKFVFINLLGRTLLGEELSAWIIQNLGSRVTELNSSNWIQLRQNVSKSTVVFCFGIFDGWERTECLRFLQDHLDGFCHVAFVDIGENCRPPKSEEPPLLESRASLFLTTPGTYFGAQYSRLPPRQRIPYIPVVSRRILPFEFPMTPIFDFFLSLNHEQEASILLRHEQFFSRKKFLVGTKWGHWSGTRLNSPQMKEQYFANCLRMRQRFPGAVFLPFVPPLSSYFYLLLAARNIVIIYPQSWKKMSYTLSTALLAGRGIITSPHPGISSIDPACFLFYENGRTYGQRDLEELFDNDRRSLLAAENARRFALRHLEFAAIIQNVVETTFSKCKTASV